MSAFEAPPDSAEINSETPHLWFLTRVKKLIILDEVTQVLNVKISQHKDPSIRLKLLQWVTLPRELVIDGEVVSISWEALSGTTSAYYYSKNIYNDEVVKAYTAMLLESFTREHPCKLAYMVSHPL